MMIQGKTITAGINADNTSIREMLTLMGVNPTDQLINGALNFFMMKGDGITMSNLYEFLKQENIMSGLSMVEGTEKLAKVVDVR